MSSVECVAPVENILGESPVWDVRRSVLWWVDSRGPALFNLDPSTSRTARVDLPDLVGSIGLRESTGLIAAMRRGFHFLEPESGVLVPIHDPEPDQLENRFNDGRCDRQGRFWAGTMNDARREPTGSLYRLDADLRSTWIRGDVIVPNSLAWSLDSRTMYFADTHRHRIFAYDFDPELGQPTGERVFADLSLEARRPDGSAIDAEGCLWNAEYAGGRVVRYSPAGKVDRVIPMPVSNPTSCAFGGAGLDVLFVTSARQRLTPGQLAKEPLAGSVFAISVGMKGVAEPRFRG